MRTAKLFALFGAAAITVLFTIMQFGQAAPTSEIGLQSSGSDAGYAKLEGRVAMFVTVPADTGYALTGMEWILGLGGIGCVISETQLEMSVYDGTGLVLGDWLADLPPIQLTDDGMELYLLEFAETLPLTAGQTYALVGDANPCVAAPMLDGSASGILTLESVQGESKGTWNALPVLPDFTFYVEEISGSGEQIINEVFAPPPPGLNDWTTEDSDETRGHAYGMPENVYGNVYMWEGAWQMAEQGIPQSLVDYGVLFAVDVWVYNEYGTPQFDFGGYQQICLLGEGRMIFMDATQSPRTMTEILPVTFEGGYTCGWIPNAGTVVLIEPGE